ncbi:hypothetical protein DITRI_Ditri09bG0012600 [Diplodiscus trichospermus]
MGWNSFCNFSKPTNTWKTSKTSAFDAILLYVQNLAFLFCCIFLCINLSSAALLKCYDTGNFTSNSTYGNNLDLIMSSLSDNVSRNGGFYMATIGQGLNRVHALALCRGDASSGACSSCISLRIRRIKASCPNQKEAILWEGDVVTCLVRLMDGWVERTSNGSSRLKFATGMADVDTEKIYALMQCTPDISQEDCKQCLMETVGQYQSCCQGKQGGYVLTPSCMFRWDLYPFFKSSAETLYFQPPQPSPFRNLQLIRIQIEQITGP